MVLSPKGGHCAHVLPCFRADAANLVKEGLDLNGLDAAGTPPPQRQTATA